MTKRQAASLSIISNSILIVFKLTAGIMMGSISVISEAIHSSIDLMASFIAFFSIRKSSQAEDSDHPFGHGKYENVSGFVEAILILFAAIIIVYESITKLVHGSNVENVWSGILVMLIASAINFVISLILLDISKKTDSIALEADAMHLLTDVYTSLGVFAGLILLKLTGWKPFDALTALFVACLIGRTSIGLIKKSMVDLVDSTLPDDEIEKITQVLNSHSEIESYHRLRTRKSGTNREIDIHIILDESISFVNAHHICDEIENEIKNIFPGSFVMIHTEPNEYKNTGTAD